MNHARVAHWAAATAVALSVLELTGCSTQSTIKPDVAAQAVVDLVAKQNNYKPTDVKCPSGVEAKVGEKFDCTFTGPRNVAYQAHMKIAKVSGDNATFDINVAHDKAPSNTK